MAFSTSAALTLLTLLLSTQVDAGLYPKSSAVLSITGKTYDRLIAQSNHTSIVEFYAPWCGHCKNLQPAYEKVARKLKGLAKVAAIDCDDESNKPFCGSMGIQGFPTLKLVKPGKKPGKPIVEDYQGPRTAKAIVDAVVDKIPNHVKRVTEKNLEEFLAQDNGPKAILFSEKGTVSALLRSLAVDFLGKLSFAQVRDKETAITEQYGIHDFPALIVLAAGTHEVVVFSGDMKKDFMKQFLIDSAEVLPNPDPAPEKEKKTKSKPKKEDTEKEKKKFESASKSHAKSEAASEKLKVTSETLEEPATTSPDPKVESAKPAELPVEEKEKDIPTLHEENALQKSCLSSDSRTCIIALLPSKASADAALPEQAQEAIRSLSAVYNKLAHRAAFPFYAVDASNALASKLREQLKLKGDTDLEIFATNAKRGWVRKYTGSAYGQQELADWVDAIKMNEGAKEKLPDSLVQEAVEEVEAAEDVAAPPAPEPEATPAVDKKEEKEKEKGEEEVAKESSPNVETPEEPVEAPEVVTEGPVVVEVEETKKPEAETKQEEKKQEQEHDRDEL